MSPDNAPGAIKSLLEMGVATNLECCTSIDGLYAIGETASKGVHGANRLASNSLLECIVFAAQLSQLTVNSKVNGGDDMGYHSLPVRQNRIGIMRWRRLTQSDKMSLNSCGKVLGFLALKEYLKMRSHN
ncbi:FAD-binding protein [Moorena sp. SIO4G3]|uniref:FAD-binding protein n=1 Tax=Moorena sp. SIO4G3 TaxID=2607821 RepID=UPI0025E94A31|nr:FAD-binding protein [Moorena sp. SIO4G3]